MRARGSLVVVKDSHPNRDYHGVIGTVADHRFGDNGGTYHVQFRHAVNNKTNSDWVSESYLETYTEPRHEGQYWNGTHWVNKEK